MPFARDPTSLPSGSWNVTPAAASIGLWVVARKRKKRKQRATADKKHQVPAEQQPQAGNTRKAGTTTTFTHFCLLFALARFLGSAPFLCGSVLGSAPFASCVLKRQRSISSFALRTPTTVVRLMRFGGRHDARFWSRRHLGRESGVSSVSTPIPKGAHAPPEGVPWMPGFKALSTMLLASGLDCFSYPVFI